MGTWGIGVFSNDNALDYLDDVNDFISHIHEKWDELGIKTYKDDKKINVSFEFDLTHDTLHQFENLEQRILVWCHVVTTHRVPIYGYEFYGAITTLRNCRSNTCLFWDDELDEQRVELFDEYIEKLREYAKDGYIIKQGEQ